MCVWEREWMKEWMKKKSENSLRFSKSNVKRKKEKNVRVNTKWMYCSQTDIDDIRPFTKQQWETETEREKTTINSQSLNQQLYNLWHSFQSTPLHHQGSHSISDGAKIHTQIHREMDRDRVEILLTALFPNIYPYHAMNPLGLSPAQHATYTIPLDCLSFSLCRYLVHDRSLSFLFFLVRISTMLSHRIVRMYFIFYQILLVILYSYSSGVKKKVMHINKITPLTDCALFLYIV